MDKRTTHLARLHASRPIALDLRFQLDGDDDGNDKTTSRATIESAQVAENLLNNFARKLNCNRLCATAAPDTLCDKFAAADKCGNVVRATLPTQPHQILQLAEASQLQFEA